jgi:SAM-dependent methyltransferase
MRENRPMPDPHFRTDLFRGTGRDYDRYRVPYPPALISELVRRTGADGTGRLPDLACGTGQVAFALRDMFAQTWAVDQEPDMIAVVRAKAGRAADLRTEISAAEDLAAPEGSFDLVTIGNAFHRMQRESVAGRVTGWLRPGGYLALAWGGAPWAGDAPWQQAMQETMAAWRERVGDRVPAGHEEAQRARPDTAILAAAGFELAGSFTFLAEHAWTPESIIGYLYSTSVLSRLTVGDLAPEFERDVREALGDAPLRQVLDFRCELARRP